MEEELKTLRKRNLPFRNAHPKISARKDVIIHEKEEKQRSINMNQITLKANAIGFINAEEYWENSRRLLEAISEVKKTSLDY